MGATVDRRGGACAWARPRSPRDGPGRAPGGGTRWSTSCTSAASPTGTATGSVTSPASAPGSGTCATSASTPCGSTPGTRRRWPTAATTWRTTAPSSRCSAPREEASALVDEAHALGLRVILDIVPNHSSDQHVWFQAGARGRARLAASARYHFRPGRGPGGDEPPNDWRSVFGGPAWTRVTDGAGRGSGTCTCSTPAQPDLNWDRPAGAGRVRVDPAVLVRPRRRRVPHRRGARPGQVRRPARPGRGRRDHARPGRPDRPPALGPRRRARDLPRVAPGRRLLSGAAGVRRRGMGRLAGAARALPAPRRAAHRVQLRLPAHAVGRAKRCARRSTTRSRPSPRWARPRPGCCPTTTSSGTSRGWAGPPRTGPGTRCRTCAPGDHAATASSGGAGPAPPPC